MKQPNLIGGIPHCSYSSLASGLRGFSIPGSGAGGEFACTLTPEAGGVRLTRHTSAAVFTDLDLYLMGLLPPDQVGDHLVFADQSQTPNKSSDESSFHRFVYPLDSHQ